MLKKDEKHILLRGVQSSPRPLFIEIKTEINVWSCAPHLLMLSDTFRTLIVLIEKHLHRSTAPLKVLHLVADNQTFSVSCPDITVAQLSWWAAHRFYVREETIRNWLEKPLGPFLSSDNRAGCVTGSRAGLQALAGCCMWSICEVR